MDNLPVSGQRLWDSLMEVARIGATPKGGCNRQTLTDLDSEGRIKAKASVSSTLDRPLLAFAGDKVRMRWPSEKRESSARMEKTP